MAGIKQWVTSIVWVIKCAVYQRPCRRKEQPSITETALCQSKLFHNWITAEYSCQWTTTGQIILKPPLVETPSGNIWRFLENIKTPFQTFGEIWKILRPPGKKCARSARKFLGFFRRYTGGNHQKTVKNRWSILGFLSRQFWKILRPPFKHLEKFGKY